jgi:hypothetical protein
LDAVKTKGLRAQNQVDKARRRHHSEDSSSPATTQKKEKLEQDAPGHSHVEQSRQHY